MSCISNSVSIGFPPGFPARSIFMCVTISSVGHSGFDFQRSMYLGCYYLEHHQLPKAAVNVVLDLLDRILMIIVSELLHDVTLQIKPMRNNQTVEKHTQ